MYGSELPVGHSIRKRLDQIEAQDCRGPSVTPGSPRLCSQRPPFSS
jgi:hypothetical protein